MTQDEGLKAGCPHLRVVQPMASPSSGSLLPTLWTRGFGVKPLSEALGRAVGNLESVSDKLPVPVSSFIP